MCGIIGYIGNDDAIPIIMDGLKKLEYRGYDSAGTAVIDNGKISVMRSEGKLVNLEKKIENNGGMSGSVGIGHTRWATHGVPNERNCHPQSSSDGKFSIVHNGIIENYAVLRTELESKGVKFSSETDTEVVVQLLSYYYEGDLLSALKKTLSKLDGSYALAILCKDYPDAVFAARKSSPLVVAKNDNGSYLASDAGALSLYTDEATTLEDGEIAEISRNELKFYNSELEIIDKKFSKIENDITLDGKGGYEHYMLKEIYEQPEKIKNLISDKISNGKVSVSEITSMDPIFTEADRMYIVACGSAYHAGMVGKYVIESLCGISTEVDVASEFRYRNPIINSSTPVVIISQSGETADSIAALRLAKSRGAKVIGIVNVPGSTIALESDTVIYTKAGREVAVATTKGYTTQMTALYLMTLHIASVRHSQSDETIKKLCEEINTLPDVVDKLLERRNEIELIAERYYERNDICFIGRNLDYAAAMECSLKLKEISYINSTAYPAGELKHGTIALVDKNSLIIALCANKMLLKKMISNIREVTSRGAEVFCICSEKIEDGNEGKIKCFCIDDINDVFSPLAEVIPMQLFAYYMAKKRKCDIDMPKNLAKSVTVE